jgi:hypothetical protein
LFTGHKLIPDGKADGIRFITFVDPEEYHRIADSATKLELGRAVGRLNKAMAGEEYALMGPGRWGSKNLDLGVRVGYADIYNTRVLVEIAVARDGRMPELSYGTHFFQDLVESGIYSLPLHIGEGRGRFNWSFFRDSPNSLGEISPQDAHLDPVLRVIDLASATPNRRLRILMDSLNDKAVGYLVSGAWPVPEKNEGTVSSF